MDASAREACAASELATARNMAKYSDLSDQYTFYLVAAEIQGPLDDTACERVGDLGRRTLYCKVFWP